MSDVHLSSRPIQDVEVPVTGRYRSLGLDRNPFVGSGPLVDLPGQQSALAEIRGWVDAVSADRAREDRLAVLTGEPGMGRSRLLREIAGAASAPVIDPGKGNLTDAQLLRAMVDAVGGTATGRTGMDLRRDIRLALADLPAGTAPGLLIDDADFTGSRLELIRNVLRDGAEHGLWIVIAGQPDLADRVGRRRSLKAILGPLARVSPPEDDDLRAVIASRAGHQVLAQAAIDAAVELAGGNPGRALRLAEVAVELAARQGLPDVDRTSVLAATRRIEDGAPAAREAVQVEIPLLPGADSGERGPATMQRSLWDMEGS